MKYQKTIDKVLSGTMTRSELAKLHKNAIAAYQKGDVEAQQVIDAINQGKPIDTRILFMGFCPGGDFACRQDIEWKKAGICTFDYIESQRQASRFNDVYFGDLVVLKKREQFGKTMKVYGHGRVKSIAYDEVGLRYLIMDWSTQDEIIEVPLMGLNSTVDIKSMEAVEQEMPDYFFEWLQA